MYHIRGLI